jgi:hypothetical protein
MADRRPDGLIEVRASWTPGLSVDSSFAGSTHEDDDANAGDGIQDHVHAWVDVLAQLAGLPPLPPGVPTVTARRARGS